jgi:hypothetical protein
MKRIITLLVSVITTLSALATDYTDQLEVIVNGESAIQNATISVTKQDDGKYTLSLKNFVLQSDDQTMGIGNITLTDIEGVEKDGVTTIKINKSINITEGDDTSVGMWMGPMLGPVPINTVAELRGDKLYVVIDIDMMSSLQQIIKVVFGNGGYQLPNSGFERFQSTGEPVAWHGFNTATGTFAGWAKGKVSQSDVVRPGSNGKSSALVKSGDVFGIVNNGTITTGRLNADSMSAKDKSNHASLDMSVTETDKNGDPFYTVLNARPDSIVVWVKFKQAKPNSDYPNATISAIITDGTYYQDPEDKTYTNKVAEARNEKIATEGGNWQRLSIPFVYFRNMAEPKAILVTASTNAEPGKGSSGDEMYLDDISLIYNHALYSLTIKGQKVELQDGVTDYTLDVDGDISEDDIVATSNGMGATIEKSITKEDNQTVVSVKVLSNDLKESTTAKVTIPQTNAIHPSMVVPVAADEVYSIDGKRVNETQTGRIYIKKGKNGTVKKVIRR